MLYEMGAQIRLLGRNQPKGEKVMQEIKSTGGQGKLSFQICDLASMKSVKDCANRILSDTKKINILVNCAGINATSKVITKDGFETNWAINYLGPFLLTQLLKERIKESTSARIVNLSTNTNFIDKMDLNLLESKSDFATDEPQRIE